MELRDLRNKMDEIDASLVKLFCERMDTAGKIAEYKKENSMPVLDASREREKLSEVVNEAGETMGDYTSVLYSLLFELSRAYQGKLLKENSEIQEKVSYAIENTNKLFPQKASVACQGVEGAYSQLACEKLFKLPSILYFRDFDNVFPQ